MIIYTPEVKAKVLNTFMERFFADWRTLPGTYYHGGAMWCWISVQVWNEVRLL